MQCIKINKLKEPERNKYYDEDRLLQAISNGEIWAIKNGEKLPSSFVVIDIESPWGMLIVLELYCEDKDKVSEFISKVKDERIVVDYEI